MSDIAQPTVIDHIDHELYEITGMLDGIASNTGRIAIMTREVATRMSRIATMMKDTDTQLAITLATSSNYAIISRNKQYHSHMPLQKTVPGHGLGFAQAAAQLLSVDIRDALGAPFQVPDIETTPPNFNHNLSTYQQIDILNLIIFYNDDFGIVPNDPLEARIEKFRRFLTEF